jgi:AcrR family transcriptional regulator
MTKKSRAAQRSEITRQSLLDAAKEMFAEKGIDLTTVDDITERADLGKGTFYYHFNNKDEVVAELIRNIMSELCDAIEKRCRGIDNLEELLDAIILAHLRFFADRPGDFVLYFQGRADLTIQEGYDGIEKPIFKYLDYIKDLLDEVIQYKLSNGALSRIAYAVAGFLSGYFSFVVIAYEEDELMNTLKPMQKALVAGLCRFIKEAAPPPDIAKEKHTHLSEDF